MSQTSIRLHVGCGNKRLEGWINVDVEALPEVDVVADVRGQAERLLQHCTLSWDERCVRFHQNARPSTTASALQVRQPMYDTSIGRWRHYADQLEPLRLQLTAAGIVCDR